MKSQTLYRSNKKAATALWGILHKQTLYSLKALSRRYALSVLLGDLILVNGQWYVTHTGLLRIAKRCRCTGIHVRPVVEFCDPTDSSWAFKATAYTPTSSKGFVGYGDAKPSNVSPLVRGSEMRVAETRAVNRALRKAYGIGICSVEELGSSCGPLAPAAGQKQPVRAAEPSNGNGYYPLRDRLCLLIRQHHLDPALVKAYGADWCDVAELRHATREQVTSFIRHLAEYAQSDRDALLCELNSYAPKPVQASPADRGANLPAAGPEKAAGDA